MHGHSPVRDVGVVKGRLEGLVLHQQPLFWMQAIMSFFECLFEPLLTLTNVGRSRIIRSIRKPHSYVSAVELAGNLDAVASVLKRVFTDFCVGVSERSILVDLVLK